MRISDWSSDVCSSDLEHAGRVFRHRAQLGFDMVEILKLVLRLVEPRGIGLRSRKLGLELRVLDDPSLFEVDQQHLAGLAAPFADDEIGRASCRGMVCQYV